LSFGTFYRFDFVPWSYLAIIVSAQKCLCFQTLRNVVAIRTTGVYVWYIFFVYFVPTYLKSTQKM